MGNYPGGKSLSQSESSISYYYDIARYSKPVSSREWKDIKSNGYYKYCWAFELYGILNWLHLHTEYDESSIKRKK